MKNLTKKTIGIFMTAVMLLSVITVGATAGGAKLGDVNRDGGIDSIDSAFVLRYDAGMANLDEEQLRLADVNKDGYVDGIDSAFILQHDAGINEIPEDVSEADSSEDLSEETSEANSSEANSSEEVSEEVSGETSGETSEEPKPEYWVPTEEDIEFICNEFIRLLNIERAKLGAQPLETAPIAHEMAMVRAEELKTLFAHERPDGRHIGTIYDDYKYNPDSTELVWVDGEWQKGYAPYAGENIGAGFALGQDYQEYSREEFLTNEAVNWVKGFANSPGHWRDLTNPEYSGVGVGVSTEEPDLSGNSHYVNVPTYICIMTMDKLYG